MKLRIALVLAAAVFVGGCACKDLESRVGKLEGDVGRLDGEVGSLKKDVSAHGTQLAKQCRAVIYRPEWGGGSTHPPKKECELIGLRCVMELQSGGGARDCDQDNTSILRGEAALCCPDGLQLVEVPAPQR